MQSHPCAPQIHKFTGGENVLQPKIIPWGRSTPSTSWLKVQNCDWWPQEGKQIPCCVFQKKSSAVWGCVLMQI